MEQGDGPALWNYSMTVNPVFRSKGWPDELYSKSVVLANTPGLGLAYFEFGRMDLGGASGKRGDEGAEGGTVAPAAGGGVSGTGTVAPQATEEGTEKGLVGAHRLAERGPLSGAKGGAPAATQWSALWAVGVGGEEHSGLGGRSAPGGLGSGRAGENGEERGPGGRSETGRVDGSFP